MHNGMANMKRLKASSINSKTPDTVDLNNSKERHASEPEMGTPHRKDFEEWPIRARVLTLHLPMNLTCRVEQVFERHNVLFRR